MFVNSFGENLCMNKCKRERFRADKWWVPFSGYSPCLLSRVVKGTKEDDNKYTDVIVVKGFGDAEEIFFITWLDTVRKSCRCRRPGPHPDTDRVKPQHLRVVHQQVMRVLDVSAGM